MDRPQPDGWEGEPCRNGPGARLGLLRSSRPCTNTPAGSGCQTVSRSHEELEEVIKDRGFARGPPAPGTVSRYNGPVEFTIRDFCREDFDTLWRIDQACFPPGIAYSRLELNVYIRRRGAFTMVATAAARESTADIVGFIVAECNRRAAGHIVTIDVLSEARRIGVGSELLRAAEDRLRTSRCQAVALETAVDNLSALAFYKRHGYSVVKTWPHYYSNGVDALVLEKDLTHSKKDLHSASAPDNLPA